MNAIKLVCETGFVLAGFTALILNLILPEEIEDDPEVQEITGEGSSQEDKAQYQTEVAASKDVEDGVAKRG